GARLQGYHDALAAAALPFTPELVRTTPDWGPDAGRMAMEQLLASCPGVTAIFAQSDMLALGAMAAIRDAGLRVPKDLSVIGYDDIPVASYLDPPLTTVRQPIRELGALATKLLIDAIAKRQRGE